MKKKSMKALAISLASIMVIAGTGCGNSTETVKEEEVTKAEVVKDENGEIVPGWKLHAEDQVDLSWYINFSWFTTGWGENMVSKKISEETGCNIEFVVPAGNEAEKLNSLIASDTLPDILTLGWYEPQVPDIINDELVYALDELADQYDPYFYQVADDGRLNWYKQEDGHVYGYPNSSFSPSDFEKYDNIASNETFLVRKDMYEAIGSPDMTTPEGFKAAVKKAVEMFPEVNGQPIIPIGAHEFLANGNVSFDKYLCDFLAVPYEKDGKIYDRFMDDELKIWLKTFRELGEEGYLKQDIFVDKRAQMSEKIAQGRYFCMLFQRTDLMDEQKSIYANNPESIYMAIDGPKNSKGDDYTLPATSINGWTLTMISKNCERPDRAIELISYLMSEKGQHLTWLGVENEMWTYVDGVPTMKDEIKELLKSDRKEYDRLYGADSCYWMLQDNAMALSWAEPTPDPLGPLERWTYPYVMSTSQYDISIPADTEELDIKSKTDNEWGVVLPKLLLAKTEAEFDSIWQEHLQKRVDFGYDKVLTLSTEKMIEAKEKLGIQ